MSTNLALPFRNNALTHHLGRTDNHVKVLGNPVEHEDVEAHLREVCAVDLVAAVAWPITNALAEGIVAFVLRQQPPGD